MPKAIAYSTTELKWVEEHCELPRAELTAQFRAKFRRPKITTDNIKALCTRKGWKSGRDGRFVAGIPSARKGKKMPFNANSAKTQFKAGQEPHNTKFSGHERVRKLDGYIEISVDETNPHTGYKRRYVLKHRFLWEQRNGPVPKGYCLKCLDGNKQNTDPANWEALPRALLPRLNGRFGRDYDSAPPELKPIILATAKLEHAAREAKKESA